MTAERSGGAASTRATPSFTTDGQSGVSQKRISIEARSPLSTQPSYTATMFTTRAAKQLRSPILRQLGRRQLHGAGEKGFQGAADNAFNRERSAVKDHAAATSGMSRAGRC